MPKIKIKSASIIILTIILVFSIFSCITIYAITPQLYGYGELTSPMILVKKQILAIIVGFLAVIAIYYTNLSRVKKIVDIGYYVLLTMLIVLVAHIPGISSIFTETINGSSGWFKIPGIGTIQPVEFMKFILIFKLAYISQQHLDSNKLDMELFKKFLFYAGLPILLVLLQPDLGGAILLAFPSMIMFLIAIKDKKLLMIIIGVIAVMLVLFIILLVIPQGQAILLKLTPLQPYQLDRINAWLYPFEYEDGLQLQQALIIIGSSGIFGHGLGYDGITFPEPHTDFIYAEFVGMFGWLAGALLIAMYFYLINTIINIGMKTDSIVYKFLCLGYASLFFVQVFENMGMILGVMPITGIVLPFMSYGGSAMLTYMAIIGVIINIDNQEL